MCGIFAAIGDQNSLGDVLQGLQRLEYRGYDSAGVAAIVEGKIEQFRSVGKVSALSDLAASDPLALKMRSSSAVIGHTRWATHGGVTQLNAHPHRSPQGHVAVVHNGIIENYLEIKEELKHLTFASETDTEVLAALLDELLEEASKRFSCRAAAFKVAYQELSKRLRGTWGLVALDLRSPGVIWASAKGSPLILGVGLRMGLGMGPGGGFGVSRDISDRAIKALDQPPRLDPGLNPGLNPGLDSGLNPGLNSGLDRRVESAGSLCRDSRDGGNICYVASDMQALVARAAGTFHMKEGSLAALSSQGIELTELETLESRWLQDEELTALTLMQQDAEKGEYAHFMRKEIHEQPTIVRAALQRHLDLEHATAIFRSLGLDRRVLHRFSRIQILACGSSWHAGLVGALLIEEMARIPVDVEISSEFRYRNPIVQGDTLVIAISQSGETADTLAAVQELKAKGVFVLGICNVAGSSLDRASDASIMLECGPEISVASTKAFTSQVVAMLQLALMLGRLHDMDRSQGETLIKALRHLPLQLEQILDREEEIRLIAESYAHYQSFFFIGRQYMYPIALEGALKLKEISYLNATGYPAGELKHGPISLICDECATVALLSSERVLEKSISNVMEVRARGGRVLTVACEGACGIDKASSDLFLLPKNIDPLMPVLASAFCQLFSYHMARFLGREIDQPRNLAKSVTVE